MKKILLFLSVMALLSTPNAWGECSSGSPEGGKNCTPGQGRSDNYEKIICANKNVGDPCETNGAAVARCIQQADGGKSCAAVKCDDGFYLWLTSKASNANRVSTVTHVEIHPDKNTVNVNDKLQSMGKCYSWDELSATCLKKCDKTCSEEYEVCVPNIIRVTNRSYNPKKHQWETYQDVWGYDGERRCACSQKTCADQFPQDTAKRKCCEEGGNWNDETNSCDCPDDKKWDEKQQKCVEKETKPQQQQLPKKPCVFTRRLMVVCEDGTVGEEELTIILTEAEAAAWNQPNCPTPEQIKDRDPQGLERLENFQKQQLEICKNRKKQKAISEASKVWDEFVAYAKDDSNKTVWKTKDGEFNKARLISDATASVVLGTVGGVVSSKIIKKKQIEKGFDVLHCTVGGQTVADWGDEFTIGLGK